MTRADGRAALWPITASMLSFLALSMKPQEFTRTRSASSASATRVQPAATSRVPISSASTWFLAQP